MWEECKKLKGCETGEAKLTSGHNLKAKYIIHTVGPVWNGGKKNEPELLAMCYKNTLNIAVKKGIKTIAFPNISTGVYGFPRNEAAEIAIREVNDFLNRTVADIQIFFCVFDDKNFAIYKNLLT